MKADSEKIKWLLDNFSQYEISRATGVAQPSLSNIKSGTRKIENLSLKVASKLTEYAEELKMEKAKQLLETSNIMDIYGYNGEDGHFYGVYGDAVGGQIDSRNVSDDVILKAIRLMLDLGEPVERPEIPTGSDFKQTFVDGYFDVVELMKQSGLIQEQEESEKVKEWVEAHKDVAGSTVKHSFFGIGKVVEIKDNTIVIDFEDYGRKSLALEAVVESDLLDFE